MVGLNTDEPSATIYGPDWHAANGRLHLLRAPALVKILRRTFKHLEKGWDTLRPIQAYHEANRAGENPDPAAAAVLYFLEVEVVDRYRVLALEMIRAVPMARGAKVCTVGFDDVQSETDLIRLYFRLAGLMGKMPEVSVPARVFAAAAGKLEPWAVEFEKLFTEVESTLKALGLDDSDEE
jgi:hypothetical protein